MKKMISQHEYSTKRTPYTNWKEVSLLPWYQNYESIIKTIFKPDQIKNIDINKRQIYLRDEYKQAIIQYLIKHYASDPRVTKHNRDEDKTTGANISVTYEGLVDLVPIFISIGIENLLEDVSENNMELPLDIREVYTDDTDRFKDEDNIEYLSVFIIEDLISIGINKLYNDTKGRGDIAINLEKYNNDLFTPYL